MKAFAADTVGLGPDSARVREIPDPVVGGGQLRVRVVAVSLNAADLKVLEWINGASFIHGKARPYVVGYDFSGVVEQKGPGASGFDIGDAVFGFLPYAGSTQNGSLAELVVVDPTWIAKKPDGVTHEQAATLGTAAVTALQGLRDKLRMRSGQKVLVHGGSGGVGTFAVQVAKKLGLEVVATASASKLDAVRGLGAASVLDYRAITVPNLPGPFDGFFDAAVKSSYGECKRLLAPGAGYLTLLPTPSFIAGKITSLFGPHHVEFLPVKANPADLTQLAEWTREGAIRPQVGAQFGIEKAADGIATFREGKVLGKIVITI